MYVYPVKPDEIYHYGMPRRSGRYPWGSGDRPYQSEGGRINTDTLRIRSLDRKIRKLNTSSSKNADTQRGKLILRREYFERRDEDTRSDDPTTRNVAKTERARDNLHAYNKFNLEKNILFNLGVAGVSAAVGNVGGVVVGVGDLAIDYGIKKVVDAIIDKVADFSIDKTYQNAGINREERYRNKILREYQDLSKTEIRDKIERDYRFRGWDKNLIGRHGWDEETAEKVFQDSVDEAVNDILELRKEKEMKG